MNAKITDAVVVIRWSYELPSASADGFWQEVLGFSQTSEKESPLFFSGICAEA
jgi:hypothetical protein